jgi:hypothetical protein
MIKVEVNEQEIDLNQGASFAVVGQSPFINPGELTGDKIYNISALKSERNQRIFSFADILNNVDRVKEYENAQVKFGGILWKVGTMKLRDIQNAFNFSFHSDSGDIGIKIKNRSLVGLALGSASNDFNTTDIYPEANHVFYTVKNPEFYGDKNEQYDGYVNLYKSADGRFFSNTLDGGGENKYNVVPFVYLLFVLEKVFQAFGYFGIEGEWTQDANIRRVTVDNNYDLSDMTGGINQYGSTIEYNRHVPNVSIGSFLIDVAICFGITYKPNPTTRKVEIVQIKDWLNNQDYTDLNYRSAKEFKLEPNDNDGFSFRMQVPSGDKAMEPEPEWLKEIIGNGSEEVTTQGSTLEMINETNPLGGEWTIPHKIETGSGPGADFELSLDDRVTNCRFMVYDGMKTDSLGNTFPQGHYLKAGFSLRWAGENGILERCYTEWMDWKTYTEYLERTVDLTIVELLQLDTERKVMIDNLKYVVQEFEASLNNRTNVDRIKTNLKLLSIKL